MDKQKLVCSVGQQVTGSEEAHILLQPVKDFSFDEETGSVRKLSAEIENVIEWFFLATKKIC